MTTMNRALLIALACPLILGCATESQRRQAISADVLANSAVVFLSASGDPPCTIGASFVFIGKR